MADMVSFVHVMEQHRSSVIEINQKLVSIVKCIVFCGRQNIPLRGHRDDDKWLVLPEINFQSLIDFCIESGDKILKEHFETCPWNATYCSKTIQNDNDIIDIIGEYISNKILVEITKSHFFSVLGDEVADASNQEQLSLILRFVDETNKVSLL